VLTIRVGLGYDPDTLLAAVFAKHLSDARPVGAATTRQGAALELTYAVRLRAPRAVAALVAELNRVEGVQAVELRERDG
jgi:hypothetical protein